MKRWPAAWQRWPAAWQSWPAAWGWPGAVALAALLAAALLAGLVTPRWQAQAQALAQAHAQAQRLAAREAARPAASPPARRLPAAADPAERLAGLLRLAPRHGVQIERTQQRIARSGGVQRQQLSLAARGRYAALRSFIAAALQADAALALDQLQLRRGGPEGDELEAELDWSLYEAAAPALET